MSQNTTPNDQNEMKDNLLIPLEMNSTKEPIIGDKQKYTFGTISIPFFIFIGLSSFLYISLIIMTCKSALEIYLKITIPLSVFLFLILICIIIMKFSKRKFELIKDVKSNTFEIKTLNYYKQQLSNEIYPLDSICIYNVSYDYIDSDTNNTAYRYGLAIVNILKNQPNLDSDSSFTKINPRKILCLIIDLLNNNQINEVFNALGISPEPDKHIFLNIYDYMGKSPDASNLCVFTSYNLSKYIKISDTYFSFYFNKLGENCCFIFFVFIITIISLFSFMWLLGFIYEPTYVWFFLSIGGILCSSILSLIFCLSLHMNRKKIIKRLDIIYSNNLDKMFIGLVNNKENAFLKTFLFDINSIERFIIENLGEKNKNNLKIIFKNKENQIICRIDEPESSLEGLLFLLNEKLNRV